jgi:hypothetical protein
MRWVFVSLAMALVAGGAGASDPMQGVKCEKPSYNLGDKVVCQYSILNDGGTPLIYDFPSAKQFDLWVTRGDSVELFRLSRNRVYAQIATRITLNAGETKTFCAEWNQKDPKGDQVGPGAYTVRAQLTPSGHTPPSTTCRVVLGGKSAALTPVTIRQAISIAGQAPNNRVSICATYRGWSPEPNDPNTKDGPPVTRSDWAICDSTGCMYVVGAVDLDRAKDMGAQVTVVGRLKKSAKGQVYLVLESATVTKKAGG